MTARLSEDDLIARFFAPLAGEGGLGLRDDAALLRPDPGHDLILTVDALVAGVHFFPDDPPGAVAVKALGVNVSDLAAKGASPAGFLLSLALPDEWTEPWLAAFAAGLGEAARAFACPLLGGDTVRANGPLSLSVTAVGQVPEGRMVRRAAARTGDRLCVTGTIGDAALGLDVLKGGAVAVTLAGDSLARGKLIDRYRVPQPRTALAQAIRDHATAAMDVSDGFAGDLAKLCAASGVSAAIDAAGVPLSDTAQSLLTGGAVGIEAILSGGDDYEILCTIPENRFDAFEAAARLAGVPVSSVGTVLAGSAAPRFIDAGGAEIVLPRLSYSHF